MKSPCNAGIFGVGMAVPERVLTNTDLEQFVDTNNEWIVTRTGILERRVCSPEERASTLGTRAAISALADAGMDASELDLIICATATGDFPWPSTACLIQREIGASRAAAFDLSAACSGFTYGLACGSAFIQSGSMQRVLVVGVDTLTKQTDWSDRATCVLFGDGAGAAVMGPCDPSEGVLASTLGADGSGFEQICLANDPDSPPTNLDGSQTARSKIAMRGAEVYKFAVKIMGDASIEVLEKAGLTPADVDLFIPHQANIRIINSAAERMNLTSDKVFINVEKYGNTSAGSIPIALTEAVQQGRIHRGDILVFVGFGAGLTWGANVIRWSRDEPRSADPLK